MLKKPLFTVSLFIVFSAAFPLAVAAFQDTTKPTSASQTSAPAAQNSASASQTSESPLTNHHIIEMHRGGLSAEIIIEKIRVSRRSFETSAKSLQELKSAGLPDAVILEIIRLTRREVLESAPTEASRAASEPETIKIPDGTPVELEAEKNISSSSIEKDDFLSFRVIESVKIGGVTVIERGALATARVVKLDKSRSFKRGGKIAIVFEDVAAVDGKQVALNAQQISKTTGESRTGEVVVTIAAATVLPTLVGASFSRAYFSPVLIPLALVSSVAGRGDEAVIPAGKRFRVFVKGDAVVMLTPVERDRFLR